MIKPSTTAVTGNIQFILLVLFVLSSPCRATDENIFQEGYQYGSRDGVVQWAPANTFVIGQMRPLPKQVKKAPNVQVQRKKEKGSLQQDNGNQFEVVALHLLGFEKHPEVLEHLARGIGIQVPKVCNQIPAVMFGRRDPRPKPMDETLKTLKKCLPPTASVKVIGNPNPHEYKNAKKRQKLTKRRINNVAKYLTANGIVVQQTLLNSFEQTDESPKEIEKTYTTQLPIEIIPVLETEIVSEEKTQEGAVKDES